MSSFWPEQYLQLKEHLECEWEVKSGGISLLKEFSDGKTAARVFAVDLKSRNHEGVAILKMCTKEAWSDLVLEAENYRLAHTSNPTFAVKHIPKVVDVYDKDGFQALLCTVAGDTLTSSVSVSKVPYETQKSVLENLFAELMSELNDLPQVTPDPVHPVAVLKEVLGYRLTFTEGGIPKFVESVLGLPKERPSFSCRDTWLPNPHAFSTNQKLWGKDLVHFPIFRGQSHCDLHPLNILTESTTKAEFYLIDLALYNENHILFYDHAYFELSYLLKLKANLTTDRWIKILKSLHDGGVFEVDHSLVDTEDIGTLTVIEGVRRSISNYVLNFQPNRKDAVMSQVLLMRAAVGLNFVNKSQLSNNDKWFSFLYSAYSLKKSLEFLDVNYKMNGPAIEFDEEVALPSSENWKAVWKECGYFIKGMNTYILVNSRNVSNLDEVQLQSLSRISWSMVLDFDSKTKQDGLYAKISSNSKKLRTLHLVYPDNEVAINYNEGVCWFAANGNVDVEDTIKTSTSIWRRHTIPPLRDYYLQNIKRNSLPSPVIVLFLGSDKSLEKTRNVWEAMDEVFQENAKYVFINEACTPEIYDMLEDKDNAKILRCSVDDLLSGLWQVYGKLAEHRPVIIPGRKEIESNERAIVTLKDEDASFIKEEIDIVYDGITDGPTENIKIGMDFWLGNEITWADLDANADVSRDITEKLKQDVIRALEEHKSYTIALRHTPGAGGSTVSRRLAWDLKTIYPTGVIKHNSENLVGRIEKLFHLSKLPVLLIVEASIVSPPAIEQLYNELRGRNVRAVFVYVERIVNTVSQNVLQEKGWAVYDPMVGGEPKRFLDRFSNIAVPGRASLLKELVESEEMVQYRSPFFFGLYSFEDKFTRVQDFVKINLSGASGETESLMVYLALITRFSQTMLPDIIVKKFLGIDPTKAFSCAVLGEGPARLLQHKDFKLKIIHPLIAQEVLLLLLSRSDDKTPDAWKTRLGDASCKFIDLVKEEIVAGSELIMETLREMFISRDIWRETAEEVGLGNRKQFSELIMMVPSSPDQNKILKTLTLYAPKEPHFFNHLGRHHIYVMGSNYQVAEECLKKATDLDPTNDIHHHALGQVYRFQVRKALDDCLTQGLDPDYSLQLVKPLVSSAEKSFATARTLDPEAEHGYITNIQLLVEVIDKLYVLSKANSYSELFSSLNSVGYWVREKVPVMEELLRGVKNIQSHESLSPKTIECQGKIFKLYDRFDLMINKFNELLERRDVVKPPIRRMIAHGYFSQSKHSWAKVSQKELLVIQTLMDQNIQDGNFSNNDLWMWFQASRRLSNFQIDEAITRLTGWAIRDGSVDAYYYLYILYYLQWKREAVMDPHFVKDYIEKCEEKAGNVRRVRSFEWLAKAPKTCPLLHQSELGPWDNNKNFYTRMDLLEPIKGSIKSIKGPQSGIIAHGPFNVFFVPGNEYFAGYHENTDVTFFLGFSYIGLRAWHVRRSESVIE